MRNVAKLVVVTLFVILLGTIAAEAQVSVSIGINLPVFPRLVVVPGYPVYYAPSVRANYFFYDGLYWVYDADNWYASSWYNGPWGLVEPYNVPLFILRIPVRYYRSPPVYFQGWRRDAPPRWDEHWGHEWQQQRGEWNQWKRGATPPPAPPPVYQRRYPEARYPPAEQQPQLHERNYRYQPRDPDVRQHYPQPGRERGEIRGQERTQERGPGHNK